LDYAQPGPGRSDVEPQFVEEAVPIGLEDEGVLQEQSEEPLGTIGVPDHDEFPAVDRVGGIQAGGVPAVRLGEDFVGPDLENGHV
jgi:hypothetical protein